MSRRQSKIRKDLKLKEKGNECFAKKDYKNAINYYSKAIVANSKESVYFSNRARC